MEALQKIRDGFAYFRTSSKHSITLKEEFYWIVKINGMQGVAIEVPQNTHVNERFSNISYFTNEYLIGGEEHHLLLLLSDNKKLFSDFAIICASFLEKIINVESNKELQNNPISWWYTMKELIGNMNVERSAYSVIAEMITYYYLLKQNEEVSWVGPFGGSADFNCKEAKYEVKSTISRDESQITINGQYQLRANYLLFFRFEPDDYGISIQDMVVKLVDLNVDEAEIEKALERLKYPFGSEIRARSYRLLEVLKYEINESFPKIIPESFIEGHLPKHISSLTYKVNLKGLSGEGINIMELL